MYVSDHRCINAAYLPQISYPRYNVSSYRGVSFKNLVVARLDRPASPLLITAHLAVPPLSPAKIRWYTHSANTRIRRPRIYRIRRLPEPIATGRHAPSHDKEKSCCARWPRKSQASCHHLPLPPRLGNNRSSFIVDRVVCVCVCVLTTQLASRHPQLIRCNSAGLIWGGGAATCLTDASSASASHIRPAVYACMGSRSSRPGRRAYVVTSSTSPHKSNDI